MPEDGLTASATAQKETQVPPTPPEGPDPRLDAVAAGFGLREMTMLRRTSKTLLAAAERDGQPVVVKVLVHADELWRAKWRHEVGIYRTFAECPPPVRVPRLIHTDGERVLILERLNGQPLDAERYPTRRVDGADVDRVLATLQTFGTWQPPSGRLVPIFDYPARVARYYAAGYLADADRRSPLALLDRCGDQGEPNHGDPLPANLLVLTGGCAVIDWEFTGLFLPGFDLAMLAVLLGSRTPAARARVGRIASDSGIEQPFAVNLAMVLTRERRMHRELPASQMRTSHLRYLTYARAPARDRIHARQRDNADARRYRAAGARMNEEPARACPRGAWLSFQLWCPSCMLSTFS